MNRLTPHPLHLAIAALLLGAVALPAAADRRAVDEHQAADPKGKVEINDISGRINVTGWDKAEVAVSGSVSDSVEKVAVETAGGRTSVRVVLRNGHNSHFSWGGNESDVNLTVNVPRGSSLVTSLVSADLTVDGVQGNQEITTTSGDVHTTAAGELHVRTVSGDLTLSTTADSKLMEIHTVSGDVHVSGSGGGEVSIETVSGDGIVTLGTVSRARVKTISGDFALTAGLTNDGRLEAESVSGDLQVHFAGGVPPAEFDLQSFSGDLTTCFGAKAEHERWGPGSRLMFKEGAGTAKVHVDTKSGDVSLCTKR